MHSQKPIDKRHGFSLIQLSLILAAGGLALAATLPGSAAGDYNQKTLDNIYKLDKVEAAMQAFMAANGRRPCPSDGQYDVNDHLFGLEAGIASSNSPQGSCKGGSPAAPMGPDNGTGYIVSGTIPTKSLHLPDDYAFDAWGRRFTYVVDTRATDPGMCFSLQNHGFNGGIQVQIKNKSGSTINTDNIMYAYISHGADGHGAFPGPGSTVANRINKGMTDGDTNTNAGVDNTFTYTPVIFTNIRVKKDRTPTFDDLVYYHVETENTCCTGSACGLSNPGGFGAQGGGANHAAGSGVAMEDINGDGIADLIVAAPNASPGGRTGAGAVYVIFGTRDIFTQPVTLTSLTGTNGFEIDGVTAGDHIGSQIAVGDINGDGITDIIIGASNVNGNEGSVYVVFGGSGTWPASMNLSALNGNTGTNGTAGFRIDGAVSGDKFGASVATGDINGDGIDDVIAGAPNSTTGAGRGYVVFGGSGTWAANMSVTDLTGTTGTNGTNGFRVVGSSTEQAGFSVASGDINGDGIDDVVFGAPYAKVGGISQAGKTYVVFGKTSAWGASLTLSTLTGANGFSANGVYTNHHSGWSVAAGDINADGIDDLVIGTPDTSVGAHTNAGSVYVVYGSNAAWSASLDLGAIRGPTTGFRLDGATGDHAGTSVAVGCDINGDGISDLIIGAPSASPSGLAGAGVTYVVFGKASGWLSTFDMSTGLDGTNGFSVPGLAAGDNSGNNVTAGDINAVGKCATIIGAPNATVGGNSGAGTAYTVLGGSNWTPTFNLGTLR